MPNYCSFEGRIKGPIDAIREFVELMKADYDYHRGIIPESGHFSRVFDVECEQEIDEIQYEVEPELLFSGTCAWSLESAMGNGPHSYYAKFLEYPNSTVTNIHDFISRHVDVELVIVGVEPGMEFTERITAENGNVEIEAEVYSEYYEDEDECDKVRIETKAPWIQVYREYDDDFIELDLT